MIFEHEPDIHVWLHTAGEPDTTPCGNGLTMVRNLAIGIRFHWQQSFPSRFSGKIEGNINTLPVEDYLKSVIGSEMNQNAYPEFLKAHAVISRSWAVNRILHAGTNDDTGRLITDDTVITWEDGADHTGFDVCSDDHCQRYQGMGMASAYPEETSAAVDATRGIVLTDDNGRIADARFSKCCGGTTELFSTCWQQRDFPYLVSHPDPYCDLSSMHIEDKEMFLNRIFKSYDRRTGDMSRWEHIVASEEIHDRLLAMTKIDIGTVTDLTPLHRGPSGRIDLLEITGTKGSLRLGKELPVRRLLSLDCLLSSNFNVEKEGDSFLIAGRGWGHGVGLCQTGAARMARDGARFDEILAFYYPHTNLTKIYD